MNNKVVNRQKIRYRIRKKVFGTPTAPRLSVFRSNSDIYAQLIDDTNGATIASASSRDKALKGITGTKSEKAKQVGAAVAAKAVALGVTKCVFDRNGYLYHGRVQNLADGAREGGLQF
ncbi:50S ribosomal protein L18 [Chitinophaga parva]|nr:50S ribosomal protein L18 [Chitinophaga parva]